MNEPNGCKYFDGKCSLGHSDCDYHTCDDWTPDNEYTECKPLPIGMMKLRTMSIGNCYNKNAKWRYEIVAWDGKYWHRVPNTSLYTFRQKDKAQAKLDELRTQ